MAWSTPEMDEGFMEVLNAPRLGMPDDIASLFNVEAIAPLSRKSSGGVAAVDDTIPFPARAAISF
jgi:hypothetical protein